MDSVFIETALFGISGKISIKLIAFHSKLSLIGTNYLQSVSNIPLGWNDERISEMRSSDYLHFPTIKCPPSTSFSSIELSISAWSCHLTLRRWMSFSMQSLKWRWSRPHIKNFSTPTSLTLWRNWPPPSWAHYLHPLKKVSMYRTQPHPSALSNCGWWDLEKMNSREWTV